MIEQLDSWILTRNRVMAIDAEELTALELIGKTATKTNEVVVAQNALDAKTATDKNELETLIEARVEKTDLKDNRKLDENGDFTGTWHGQTFVASDAGVSSEVTAARLGMDKLVDLMTFITNKIDKTYVNVKYPPGVLVGAMGDGLSDDTAPIRTIINAGYKKLIIPDGTYFIDGEIGISLKDNMNVILSPNATLIVKPTSADAYTIFDITNVANVTLTGGILEGERDQHIGSTGESGFGIQIKGSTNINIVGVSASNFWGDGFYVGSSVTNGESKNVNIIRCNADNNRRQGLSIVACDGGLVLGGEYKNTNGTAPQSGIDLEPNGDYVVQNIKVVGARLLNNSGYGLQCSGKQNEIIGCKSIGNIGGYYLSKDDNLISESEAISNTGDGIFIVSCLANRIVNNIIKGCVNGVTMQSSANENIVANNIIKDNTGYGVKVDRSKNNKISNNSFKNNVAGVYMTGLTGQLCTGNDINDNECLYGIGNGIRFDSFCELNSVKDNNVSYNGTAGIRLIASNNNNIMDNLCVDNSQSADNTYENIFLDTTSANNNVQGNTCRMVSATLRPKYGLRAGTSTTGNLIVNNDLLNSGATSNLSDTSTTNVKTISGNRV
jgi:parallel beta-helix repeat protein